jgi:hypothetical protein
MDEKACGLRSMTVTMFSMIDRISSYCAIASSGSGDAAAFPGDGVGKGGFLRPAGTT